MRNRAKCKLCNDLLESFHRTDFVECSCGEISIDGGDHYFRCAARDFRNFIRIDDDDREIIVKFEEESNEIIENKDQAPTKEELLEMLNEITKSYEKLPPNAMTLPPTNYELHSLLILLCAIFRSS